MQYSNTNELIQRLSLRSIFNRISEGIFTVDNNLVITNFNKSAEEITGYKKEEMLGSKCWDILQGKLCDVRCYIADTRDKGTETEDIEIEIIDKQGKGKTLLFSTTLLLDEKDVHQGVLVILKDISEIKYLRESLSNVYHFGNIIGKNKKMLKVYQLVEQVSQSNASVLIQGETGTGKEMIASAIHYNSPRRDKPFVKVNCSALAESLLESELFGHVKGAFTGAIYNKMGRFEASHQGTIFLDEIGDLTPFIQLKLLRVLQEKEFERVGDTKPVKIDVRVIAATNKDLKRLMEEGIFRQDLYYRLKVVTIDLPPLRERRDDIPLLIDHFMKRYKKETSKDISVISEDAVSCLLQYDWHGNIRELENAIEHAFVVAKGGKINLIDLPQEVSNTKRYLQKKRDADKSSKEMRELILQVLNDADGNKLHAARILGIGRTTLYRRLKEYGID